MTKRDGPRAARPVGRGHTIEPGSFTAEVAFCPVDGDSLKDIFPLRPVGPDGERVTPPRTRLGTAPLPLTSAPSNSAAAIARSRAARSSLAVSGVSSIPARAPGSRAMLMKAGVGSPLAFKWRYCSGSCSNSTPFILSRVLGSGPRPSEKASSSTRRPCSSPGRPKFPSTQRGSV
jgi:hypothetical protein